MKTLSQTLCAVYAVLASVFTILAASADDPQPAGLDSDRDGDGLTLAQELSLGSDPSSPDSDGDGWDDGDEVINGRSPTAVQALEAPLLAIHAEIFTFADGPDGKPSHPALRAFAAGKGFVRKQQESRELSRLAFSDLEKDDFASRIRVLVTAPQSGDYKFAVAGDDESELWLSTDDTPFQRRCVARSKWWTEFFDWSGHPSQQSTIVRLEAGHRYYLEVRGMEYAGTAHWEAGWSVNGGPIMVIPRRLLTTYEKRSDDADDNGLPDAWEASSGLSGVSADGDEDGDHLTSLEEFQAGSNPVIADSVGRPGLVRCERWDNLPGRQIFDLTKSGRFPGSPDSVTWLRAIEAEKEQGDNFGQRIRGALRAPQSGEFVFYIAGNDHCELWLSSDPSSMHRRRIARVEGDTASREWEKFAGQWSEPVLLTEGNIYYFEVLHKGDKSADHVAVAWKKPNDSAPAVIDGAYLAGWSPEPEDADDNGLPDAWEAGRGIQRGISPFTDSDGDGVSNWQEYVAHTNPALADNINPTRGLKREVRRGIGGNEAARVRLQGAAQDAIEQSNLSDLDYSGLGFDYASRLRGRVVAPVGGTYTFSVAGDNEVELWLSPSGDPFRKECVARVNSWVARREWRRSSAQESSPITLAEGQSCYLEVIHKQGIGEDHLSVGWTVPGHTCSVILGDYLLPYQAQSGDANDNGLPDAWEKATGLTDADDNGWAGDPDGDLLSNLQEYQLGLNPLKADAEGLRGFALWEGWDNIQGNYVIDLTQNPRFPLEVDARRWVTSFASPPDRYQRYGGRVRALLEAPETANYTFWVAGDNQCQLWLSRTDKKFSRQLIASVPQWSWEHEWDKYPAQRSRSVRLEAGRRYFIEALHKDDGGYDSVAVAWQGGPIQERTIVSGEHLIAFSRDPEDWDDDDLPDAWEATQGLDPLLAGGRNGAAGDPDHDGLSNADEYAAGTSALSADTDGDGLLDGDEIKRLHSDPLKADAALLAADLDTGAGGYARASEGWHASPGNAILLTAREGELTYRFEVKVPGPRLFRIEALLFGRQERGAAAYGAVTVDAVSCGDFDWVSTGGAPAVVTGLTQWLAAGEHELTVKVLAGDSATSVRMKRTAVYVPGGADGNGNGLPDWLDDRRAEENTAVVPAESATSPACIEGDARFPSLVRAASAAGDIQAFEGVEGRWIANLPLEAAGKPTPVNVNFEENSMQRAATITWTETVVGRGGELTLRKGDSLRLSARANGAEQATIIVQGPSEKAVLETNISTPVIFRFDAAGDYSVRVEGNSGNALLVHALEADFGEPFIVYSGHAGLWESSGVPAPAVVEADARLEFSEEPRENGGNRIFRVLDRAFGKRRVLARTAPDGPVLTVGEVQVLRLSASTIDERTISNVGTLSDGTQILRLTIYAEQLPPGGKLVVRIHAAGVTFADGTVLKEFTAKDFGADGTLRIDLLRTPGVQTSVCHSITVFDAHGRRMAHFD